VFYDTTCYNSVVVTKKVVDLETLCIIRPSKGNERGDWVVVVEGMPLTLGWFDLEHAVRFTEIVLGASSFAQKDETIYVTRFDRQRKYRVPNHFNLDEAISRDSESRYS